MPCARGQRTINCIKLCKGAFVTVEIPPPPARGVPRSPFTPTFGTLPPAFVGRQGEVTDFAYALDNGPGSTGRTTLITGQRGMGKSVLLEAFHQVAESRQWVSVHAQATPGFVDRLTRSRIPEALEKLDMTESTKRRWLGLTLPAGGGGITTSVEDVNPVHRDFEHQLMRVAGALDEHGTGLLVTLDEVHRSNIDELREVAGAVARATAEEAPVAFVAAGLPSTINGLVNDDVSTFLRRSERVTLTHLAEADTRVALEKPLHDVDRAITPAALDTAVAATGNYPYLVQLIGDKMWKAAGTASTITKEHVRRAVRESRESMFRQIHESTVESLSDMDREYLRAMAVDDGASSTSEVARRLKKTPQYAGVYRNRLIAEGIIGEAGRGKVDFTVPYLRDYLRRG